MDKISHWDKGKKGIVKYRAEEPDGYCVETDKRLVSRTQKHLRPLSTEVTHKTVNNSRTSHKNSN